MLALASDFDNTLYFMWEEAHFKDGDLEAIRKFREAGNLFGVCTGRSWRGITDVTDGVLDLDFYILESGSLILDGDQNVLFKKCLSRATMTRLVEDFALARGLEFVVHAGETVYGKEKVTYSDGTSMESFLDMTTDDIFGVSYATENEEQAVALIAAIEAAHGDEVICFQNAKYVDTVSRGCSKGIALNYIKEHLGIETIGGIGDSYNDLTMLKEADVSFTFHSSPLGVQKEAGHLVDQVAGAIDILMDL